MTPQETLRAHLANTITLTDSEFDHLFSHLKPSSFKKGQSIISEGDHVDGEYFVLKGCLKTFYVNEDQKTFILQFAMPTWWASDYGAIYGNGIAAVNLDYIVNSDVLFLSNVDRE
jgi:CRP-like cAMP-binding protein